VGVGHFHQRALCWPLLVVDDCASVQGKGGRARAASNACMQEAQCPLKAGEYTRDGREGESLRSRSRGKLNQCQPEGQSALGQT